MYEKGRWMASLEELEKKVLQIINCNKELNTTVGELTKENEQLKEKNHQLESRLMSEAGTKQSLEEEKVEIKNSIENILNSISSLDNGS